MTTPTHVTPLDGVPAQMSPERWRAVDTILQAALACEPERRVAVIADLCGDDGALRIEVASLLAAHVDAGDDFLERPAMASIDGPPLVERLSHALGDRYQIEREIARGGMATVYLARDLKHGRRVAIKVLREEVAAAVGAERFLAEIRVTASLQHPHILPLFDSGSANGLLWYAMPFVEGETLRSRLLRDGALPIDESVRLAREIADALDHAHARGLVHRDVKPENVLLRDGHALVADFGIALALEQAGGERLTRTGLALGTPQYMAPEQAAGERALDARVDVYALGAVLHEMLAGEAPFAAPTRQAVVRRMMHETPPALATRRPDVAPFVAAAVRRALAKRPADRFPSAAAFAASLAVPLPLSSHVSAPGTTRSDELPATPRGRTVSARAAVYTVSATLVLGLIGGLILDRAPLAQRWTGGAPSLPPPSVDVNPGAPVIAAGDMSLMVIDRAGHTVRGIDAERPWTPRFSPDGRRVAYGAYTAGRQSSDIFVTDIDAGTTQRITDDDGDSNDPQWSADGKNLGFSVNAPSGKDIATRALAGGGTHVVAQREGMQFPSDWLRDGSAFLITDDAGGNQHDILIQPADGSPARPYVATRADELAARISPDGHWVAYTSDESGTAEVYLDSYPKSSRRRVKISLGGGMHAIWRGDGRELYYWRDGALVAVKLGASKDDAPPVSGAQTVLFRAPYQGSLNTMYDVSSDGQRFVIVLQR
ncbi:MAG: protein kinase [Gemmatimonadaceae bacterium]